MFNRFKKIGTILCFGFFAQIAIADVPALNPVTDPQTGRIFAYIPRADLNRPKISASRPKRGLVDLAKSSHNFIDSNKSLFGLDNLSVRRKFLSDETDKIGYTTRYSQLYKRTEVYGTTLSVNTNLEGDITYVKAKLALVDELPPRVKPKISLVQARKIARSLAQQEAGALKLGVVRAKLVILPLGLIFNKRDADAHLAWQVTVADQKSFGNNYAETFYIEAGANKDKKVGDKILQISGHQKLFREVYDCAAENGLGNQMNGRQFNAACQNLLPLGCGHDIDVLSPLFSPYVFGRSEGKPERGPYPNSTPKTTVPTPHPLMPVPTTPTPTPTPIYYYQTTDVDKFYDYFGALHSYYQTNFLIDGANRQGGIATGAQADFAPKAVTRGLANVDGCSSNLCPGSGLYANATTGTMLLCVGNVVPDSIGHEYYHAVVNFSGPGNFTYVGQPGSLNEGSADFMGELFEFNQTGTVDWKDRTGPMFPPFRDIGNPGSITNPYYLPFQPYPDRFYSPGYYCGSYDAYGVHDNSTVISHALYLISEGGELNGCTIQGQGMSVAQQVLFRGWNTKFSQSVSYGEAYTDLIQACGELYSASVCAEVTKALQAAELDQPGKCSGIPEVAPACAVHNEGTQNTTYRQHNVTTVYSPTEQIWLSGAGGVAGKVLNVYMQPHAPSVPTWSTIGGSPVATLTVQGNATSLGLVATASTVGQYDILIDGNRDGYYQPWADTIIPIEVKYPVNNDGACYRGDSYVTSENCQDQTNDCRCTAGYSCRNPNNSNQPVTYMCWPDFNQGPS